MTRTKQGNGSGTPPAPRHANGGRERSALDELDRGIIRLLQTNGRISNTEISRALSVTETTVRNRVARLLEEELIAIAAVPTPQALGMTLSALIGISVNLKELDRVAQKLVSCPETRYVGFSTGRYDLFIEAFFKSQDHLLEFVMKTLGSLEGIKDIETSVILRVSKRAFLEV